MFTELTVPMIHLLYFSDRINDLLQSFKQVIFQPSCTRKKENILWLRGRAIKGKLEF